MKYLKTFENQSTKFEIGDWVYLKTKSLSPWMKIHTYDMIKNQPAQIENIKKISKDKIKYTLTYSKGWQKSFILWNKARTQISDYLRKANPEEYKEFEKDMEITKLKKIAKKYNL